MPGVLEKIRQRKALDDEIRSELQKGIKEAKERFKAEKGRST